MIDNTLQPNSLTYLHTQNFTRRFHGNLFLYEMSDALVYINTRLSKAMYQKHPLILLPILTLFDSSIRIYVIFTITIDSIFYKKLFLLLGILINNWQSAKKRRQDMLSLDLFLFPLSKYIFAQQTKLNEQYQYQSINIQIIFFLDMNDN